MEELDGTLLIATDDGLLSARSHGAGLEATSRRLGGHRATGVVSDQGTILVGTTNGIFRSDDGGQTWTESAAGLTPPHVRWMSTHPTVPGGVLAGTEPAEIFVSHDAGRRWRSCPEVAELRDQHRWFLPYSPEAGCVRGFAFHGRRPYAAVEVGGVLRSDDAGDSWRLAGGSTGEPVFEIPPAPFVFSDVHSVEGHPSSPDLVFAVTAEGLYRSEDGGDGWSVSHAGSYCRAAWIDPVDPDHVVLGPADSVSRKNGRIEESRDGGRTWHAASDGLDLPWPDRMVERFAHLGSLRYAITDDGRLYVCASDRLQWERVLGSSEAVRAVAQYCAG